METPLSDKLHEANILIRAARHVVEGRRIVARQVDTIARLRRMGVNTIEAEGTLNLFRQTLAIFEEHDQDVLNEIGIVLSLALLWSEFDAELAGDTAGELTATADMGRVPGSKIP
jgi:hypothetical protein